MNEVAEEMVTCPKCKGSGEGKDRSVYVNGEFYGDCLTVCPLCQGKTKVTKQQAEEYEE